MPKKEANLKKNHYHHEPLIRIAKRSSMKWYQNVGIRLLGVCGGLLISALIIMFITKLNPVKVYQSMFLGAFGSLSRFWVTIRDLTLLLCISVGLAPAFKMRFWNIGAEGQILVGGLAAAAFMKYFSTLPNWFLLSLMFVVSILAGAIWGVIPALFKAKWGTNETLFTLMMNYVAIQIVEHFVDLWDKKQSHSVGIINMQTKAGWFPALFGQQYLLNVVIVVMLTLAVYFYLRNSKHGYEISVVGESENTARYAGINVKKVIIRTMLLSGAICGLAGFLEVAGSSHTISRITAGGRGFTAIIVAWMAKFNTLTMALITLLIVFLDRGACQIASDFGMNEFASEIVTGVILFFILGSEFFVNYRLIFRKKHKEVEAA